MGVLAGPFQISDSTVKRTVSHPLAREPVQPRLYPIEIDQRNITQSHETDRSYVT